MSFVFLVMLENALPELSVDGVKTKKLSFDSYERNNLVFLGGQKSKSPQIFQDVGCRHLQLSPTRFVKAI